MSERSDYTRQFAAAAQLAKDLRGWSVRDLASRSGVPVMSVHRAVTTGNVLLSSALRIAAVLGLRMGDLAEPAPGRTVHLLREDFSLACGQDGKVYSSGVLAEVTCPACKEVR